MRCDNLVKSSAHLCNKKSLVFFIQFKKLESHGFQFQILGFNIVYYGLCVKKQ